jgi:hypothetical protein
MLEYANELPVSHQMDGICHFLCMAPILLVLHQTWLGRQQHHVRQVCHMFYDFPQVNIRMGLKHMGLLDISLPILIICSPHELCILY